MSSTTFPSEEAPTVSMSVEVRVLHRGQPQSSRVHRAGLQDREAIKKAVKEAVQTAQETHEGMIGKAFPDYAMSVVLVSGDATAEVWNSRIGKKPKLEVPLASFGL